MNTNMKVAGAVTTVATLPDTDQETAGQTEEFPGVRHTFPCIIFEKLSFVQLFFVQLVF